MDKHSVGVGKITDDFKMDEIKYTVEWWRDGTPEIYRTTTNKREAMQAYQRLRSEIQCNAALERKHTSVVLYEGVRVIASDDTSGLYIKFKKHEVAAASLEEFCEKYHRPFENTDYGREQRKGWLVYAQKTLEAYGYVMIPSSTTTTGLHAVWYGGTQISKEEEANGKNVLPN